MNLFESIESVFLFQRIFCILPLKWNRSTGHLKTTRLMKLYVLGIIAMISFISIQSIFVWNCMELLRTFVPNGTLWTVLFGYNFAAMYIHFLLNILYYYIYRSKHIEVLKLFHSIDKRFRIELGQEVDHRRHKRQINIGITLIFLYYLSGSIFSTIYWYYTLDQPVMIPFNLVYDFERISLHLSTYMSINYILLIRARCDHLLNIYKPLQFEYHQYLRGGGADRIISNYFFKESQKVFALFQETCSLFNICVASFGWNNLLEIMRSFATNSLQIYILWTFLMKMILSNAETPYIILYLLFGEILCNAFHTIVLDAAFSTVCSSDL